MSDMPTLRYGDVVDSSSNPEEVTPDLEELIISDEDAVSTFKKDRKAHDVEVVFTQAKRCESFDLGDFLKFKESVLRFVNSEHYDIKDRSEEHTSELQSH